MCGDQLTGQGTEPESAPTILPRMKMCCAVEKKAYTELYTKVGTAKGNLFRIDSTSSTRSVLHPGDQPAPEPDEPARLYDKAALQDLVSQQYWERLPPTVSRAVFCTEGVLRILSCSGTMCGRLWPGMWRCLQGCPDPSIPTDLSEIVLECLEKDGEELLNIRQAKRAVALSIDNRRGRVIKTVGRQYQPQFFSEMLPQWERFAWISRKHVNFIWDPSVCKLQLTRLSRVPVSVDGRKVDLGETVRINAGMRLVLHSPEGEADVMAFTVRLRTLSDLRREGPHPASRPLVPKSAAASSGWATPLAANHGAVTPAVKAPFSLPILSPQSSEMSTLRNHRVSGAFARRPPSEPNGSSAASDASQGSTADLQQSRTLAVLECVFAKGLDLEALPLQAKLLRLPLGRPFEIGRACQNGFFENLLKVETHWAAYVSRRHCRLLLSAGMQDSDEKHPPCQDQSCALNLTIENLSYNPVLVNAASLPRGTSMRVSLGETLSFIGSDQGTDVFLKFAFRPFLACSAEHVQPAPHPWQPSSQPQMRMLPPPRAMPAISSGRLPLTEGKLPHPWEPSSDSATDVAAAVLECVYTVGNDLVGLPPQAKALGLPLGVSVEIGRLCQPGFFERLLEGEPQWITQLSRKHCLLQLSLEDGGAIRLSVQNLGTNTVFVDGKKLANDCWNTLAEGGTLGFAATVSGTQETRFLKLIEFMLKRELSSDEASAV